MVHAVHPYLRHELSMPEDTEAQTRHWLQTLVDLELLEVPAAAEAPEYAAPDRNSPEFHRLQGLANVILQTLERQYIVVATLAAAGQGALTRGELESRCHAHAQRMSRLQGLNAPEFFDIKLIRGLVTLMFSRGVLFANADDRLNFNETIHTVNAAAEKVIGAEFRQALLRS